jgi:hypothetical protein
VFVYLPDARIVNFSYLFLNITKRSAAAIYITIIIIVYSHTTNFTLTSGSSSGTFPIHVRERMAQSHLALVLRSKCKCIADWSLTNQVRTKSNKPNQNWRVQCQCTEQYQLDFTWQKLRTSNNRVVYDSNVCHILHASCNKCWCFTPLSLCSVLNYVQKTLQMHKTESAHINTKQI